MCKSIHSVFVSPCVVDYIKNGIPCTEWCRSCQLIDFSKRPIGEKDSLVSQWCVLMLIYVIQLSRSSHSNPNPNPNPHSSNLMAHSFDLIAQYQISLLTHQISLLTLFLPDSQNSSHVVSSNTKTLCTFSPFEPPSILSLLWLQMTHFEPQSIPFVPPSFT